MKLTVEHDSETIGRYGHVRPAPIWGGRCSARCPGSMRTCTLGRGHRGTHIAHGIFRKVLAVWDEDVEVRPSGDTTTRAAGDRARTGLRKRALVSLEALRDRVARLFTSVEEVSLLILFLAFVWFAIDWALRIIG
jgi:hypothetical protein